jgi:lysophospholipase-1
MCSEALYGLGIEKDRLTIMEYEDMGHVMGAAELRDLCAFLEKVVPEMN